jgi:hypothetical protein
MYFEGRELTTYANPVKTEKLIIGECYFQLTYIDDDMCIPIMNTVVYVGQNLVQGDTGLFYFQDVDSYIEGRRFVQGEDSEITLHCCDKNSVNNVFEFEHALEGLMVCFLTRQAKPKSPLPNARQN